MKPLIAERPHKAQADALADELATLRKRMSVVDHHAWYIENALRQKLDDMNKQVKEARETLASAENDGSAPYRMLEGMCSHVDWAARDFQKAYDALKEIGIK